MPSRVTTGGDDVNTLTGYLIVFFGAGIGGMFRHAVNRVAVPYSDSFPWGTFAINLAGGLAMGLVAGWFAFRGEASQQWRLFVATGVIGGFTTFSAFSLEVVLLWERGAALRAVGYAGGSVALSVIALFSGMALLRR